MNNQSWWHHFLKEHGDRFAAYNGVPEELKLPPHLEGYGTTPVAGVVWPDGAWASGLSAWETNRGPSTQPERTARDIALYYHATSAKAEAAFHDYKAKLEKVANRDEVIGRQEMDRFERLHQSALAAREDYQTHLAKYHDTIRPYLDQQQEIKAMAAQFEPAIEAKKEAQRNRLAKLNL